MIEHFRRLFAYDAWANGEVMTALSSASAPPSRSIKLLVHVVAAEKLWLERIQGQKQSLPVWPEFFVRECEAHLTETTQLWKAYVATLAENELSRSVTYTNSAGVTWTSNVSDILTHVIMHSVYHRGQIALDMRAAGLAPPYTDFVHGIRQRLVE